MKKLFETIVVKYNDGVVKQEKDGEVIDGRVERPGRSAAFNEAVVKATGDRWITPETKK